MSSVLVFVPRKSLCILIPVKAGVVSLCWCCVCIYLWCSVDFERPDNLWVVPCLLDFLYWLSLIVWVKRIPLQFANSAYKMRIPPKICRFHLQLQILWQLKFTKGIYYYLFMGSTNWFRIPQLFCVRIVQSCLFLERFWATQCISYLSMEFKTAEKIKEK